MEKKQSKVEELKKKAEASWEGCHGCNESDRDMWINGYIKGALANQIELPTDKEIEGFAKDKINLSNDCFGQYDFTSGKQDGFIDGAIWMRDKIQGGGDESSND